MAHLIDMSNGRANMAYATGTATPWHGLGFQIAADATIDEWRKAAGLDWEIKTADLSALDDNGQPLNVGELNRKLLYRSDTKAPLSIMSKDMFKVVQPDEILSFIGDSVKAMGWKMETAGSLNNGRRIWALANIGAETELAHGDNIRGYLLAATGCDGTMASDFMFTSVRVVCNNTLRCAIGKDEVGKSRVKVYHFQDLDVKNVKQQLGIAESVWSNFIERAKQLTQIKVSEQQAVKVLRNVYAKKEKVIVGDQIVTDEDFMKSSKAAAKVLELFNGQGIGAELASARGTAWGLVNATTEFYDHIAGSRNANNRLNSAWFGIGAQRKQDVVDACFEMAA